MRARNPAPVKDLQGADTPRARMTAIPQVDAFLRVFSASVGGEAGSGPVFDASFTGGVFVGGQ